jgi:hypothetical protein
MEKAQSTYLILLMDLLEKNNEIIIEFIKKNLQKSII